jgi:N6-adenosine-specific RNA methylase IME4
MLQRADIFDGLPRGYYRAIAVDPPLRFVSYTALQVANWKSRRDVDKHYRTMSCAEIAELPVGELAAHDAHLFLWATGPNLPKAFELIEAWGFRYSAIAFIWIKLRPGFDPLQFRLLPLAESDLHVGLGLTTRHNAEICLLARRGNARRNSKAVREVILSPVREHSRKPDEFFRRVEAYCDGPYLELFARERRAGWDAWGDEISRFNRSDSGSRPREATDIAPADLADPTDPGEMPDIPDFLRRATP